MGNATSSKEEINKNTLSGFTNRQIYSSIKDWKKQEFGSKGNSSSQLDGPRGIYYDKLTRNYIVAEQNNSRFQVFDENGEFVAFIGSRGPEDGQFQIPIYSSVSRDGRIICSDYGNNRLQIFDQNRNYLFKLTGNDKNSTYIRNPCGNITDFNDRIGVCCFGSSYFNLFSTEGTPITSVSGPGSEEGSLNGPCGLAINSVGHFYIGEHYNRRISMIDSNSKNKCQFTLGNFGGNCVTIAIDDYDQLLVADHDGHAIFGFDMSGFELFKFNQGVPSPAGICCGFKGCIGISDYTNHKIIHYINDESTFIEEP